MRCMLQPVAGFKMEEAAPMVAASPPDDLAEEIITIRRRLLSLSHQVENAMGATPAVMTIRIQCDQLKDIADRLEGVAA